MITQKTMLALWSYCSIYQNEEYRATICKMSLNICSGNQSEFAAQDSDGSPSHPKEKT
jgi:hypothetical protein